VEESLKRLQKHQNDLEATIATLNATVASLPPILSPSQISAALSVTGSAPLNLTGLLGTPAQSSTSSTTAPTVNTGPIIPPAPPGNPAQNPPPIGPILPPGPVTGSPAPPSPGGVTSGGAGVPLGAVNAIIYNSPDVSTWSVTTTISQIVWGEGPAGGLAVGTSDPSVGVLAIFDKQNGANRWPDVPFGDQGGTLEYTQWILLQIGGQWYASGIVQCWFGRNDDGVVIDDGIGLLWVSDSRWGPMAGHQPAPGEIVGWMVTAGDARGTDVHLVTERSDPVFIAWPGDVTPYSATSFVAP
jgi:hypothetical protein